MSQLVYCPKVITHYDLNKVTEEELGTQGAKVVSDANEGIQTAVVASDGSVRAVVGLNCVRYLPNVDPDPLDEIAWSAIEAKNRSEAK